MDEARNECQSMGPMGTQAARMSTKDVIERKIIDLKRKIAALQIIQDAMPWKIITTEDEERLWDYFSESR